MADSGLGLLDLGQQFSRWLNTARDQSRAGASTRHEAEANLVTAIAAKASSFVNSLHQPCFSLLTEPESQLPAYKGWFNTNVLEKIARLCSVPHINPEKLAEIMRRVFEPIIDGCKQAYANLNGETTEALECLGEHFARTPRADDPDRNYGPISGPIDPYDLASNVNRTGHYRALMSTMVRDPKDQLNDQVAQDPKLARLFSLLVDQISNLPGTTVFSDYSNDTAESLAEQTFDGGNSMAVQAALPYVRKALTYQEMQQSLIDALEPGAQENGELLKMFYALLHFDIANAKEVEPAATHSRAMRFLKLAQDKNLITSFDSIGQSK